MIFDADFSAIEARIVSWLSGEESSLQQFRDYDAAETEEEKISRDVYRILAAQIYSLPVSQIKKTPHRFIGKYAKLGLGFGMGKSKFRDTVKVQGKYDLPYGLENTAVDVWRAQNRRNVAYWYDVENACKKAILTPGQQFGVQPKSGQYGRPDVRMLCREIGGMVFLLIRLPSGRKLAYPKPKIRNDRITYYGNYKGEQWGDVETWGGTFVENITQAVAADIMANGAHQCENAGYQIFMLVHDQGLAFKGEGQTAEQYVKLLTSIPDWAEGLPIAAEGAIVPFYKKD